MPIDLTCSVAGAWRDADASEDGAAAVPVDVYELRFAVTENGPFYCRVVRLPAGASSADLAAAATAAAAEVAAVAEADAAPRAEPEPADVPVVEVGAAVTLGEAPA